MQNVKPSQLHSACLQSALISVPHWLTPDRLGNCPFWSLWGVFNCKFVKSGFLGPIPYKEHSIVKLSNQDFWALFPIRSIHCKFVKSRFMGPVPYKEYSINLSNQDFWALFRKLPLLVSQNLLLQPSDQNSFMTVITTWLNFPVFKRYEIPHLSTGRIKTAESSLTSSVILEGCHFCWITENSTHWPWSSVDHPQSLWNGE